VPSPRAREAWPASFRQEPPALLEGRPPSSLSAALAARMLRAAGIADGRAIGLLALAAALLLAARWTTAADRSLAWAVVALAPVAVIGASFGSEAPLWLDFGLLVLAASARAPAGAARGVAAILGLAGLLDATALVLFRPLDPGAGVGLVNLAAYVGLENTPALQIARTLGHLAVLAAIVWTWRRAASRAELLSGAALALLLALFFAPVASPFRLAVPLALLGLSAVVRPEDVRRPATA
jgi:hypothetical protein